MASKKFITAVGRRKTAIASVRMVKAAKGSVMVNGKTLKDYFKTDERAKDCRRGARHRRECRALRGACTRLGRWHRRAGRRGPPRHLSRHHQGRATNACSPQSRRLHQARPARQRAQEAGGLKARKAPQWSSVKRQKPPFGRFLFNKEVDLSYGRILRISQNYRNRCSI